MSVGKKKKSLLGWYSIFMLKKKKYKIEHNEWSTYIKNRMKIIPTKIQYFCEMVPSKGSSMHILVM